MSRSKRKPKSNVRKSAPKKDDMAKLRDAVAQLSREAKQAESAPNAAKAALSSQSENQPEELSDAIRRAEAILFASSDPIAAQDLAAALPPGSDVARVLMELKTNYANRGVNLQEIAGKWRFQTASDLSFLFEETREEERKLSKAAMETLTIIAYCQPVTRAEIEDVRGVAVSRGTLDVLMEQNWVRVRGRRRSPGRPVTYGVTEEFLIHFGLESLDSLPSLEEMKAAGILSAAIPDDFDMPRPSDSEATKILSKMLKRAKVQMMTAPL